MMTHMRLDNENDHKNRRNGIQWILWGQLDDLDFADDLALLSHSHEQIQEKTCEILYNVMWIHDEIVFVQLCSLLPRRMVP